MRRTPTFYCRQHVPLRKGKFISPESAVNILTTKICVPVGTSLGVCSDS